MSERSGRANDTDDEHGGASGHGQDVRAVVLDSVPPERVAEILALAGAAAAYDGIAPLSEHTVLGLRRNPPAGDASPGSSVDESAGGVRHVLLIGATGETIGYGRLDLPLPAGRSEAEAGAGTHAGTHEGIEAGADADTDAAGEFVVHPEHRRRGHGRALLRGMRTAAGPSGLRVWAHGDLPAAAALAAADGLERVRALWRMRRSLAAADGALPEIPALPAGVRIRAFAPGHDEAAWTRVNRLAFADHPEQGAWTVDDLLVREREPWFDPAGFFVSERDGELIGFHWTKVHAAAGEGGHDVGEVYVVGVSPAAQGLGLGRVLTLTGLHHLRDRGLAEVMLYVDEDKPARRLYESLGFERSDVDVMYRGAPVS